MRRTVMTNNPTLDLTIKYRRLGRMERDFKPHGLWYSINNEWLDWCCSEMPDWKAQNIIKIEIDEKNMLIIASEEDFRWFKRNFFKPSSQKHDLGFVQWNKVKTIYDGIEIQNYHAIKDANRFSLPGLDDLWLCTWDVSSGCIWNLKVIKKQKTFKIIKNELEGI